MSDDVFLGLHMKALSLNELCILLESSIVLSNVDIFFEGSNVDILSTVMFGFIFQLM